MENKNIKGDKKRRIYDVINVLEGLEALHKCTNGLKFCGLDHLPGLMHRYRVNVSVFLHINVQHFFFLYYKNWCVFFFHWFILCRKVSVCQSSVQGIKFFCRILRGRTIWRSFWTKLKLPCANLQQTANKVHQEKISVSQQYFQASESNLSLHSLFCSSKKHKFA